MTLYEFCCVPFGLSSAPRLFTKLMKPVVSCLRKNGFVSVIYLDDFILMGNSKKLCTTNVQVTLQLLQRLGFMINYKKSNLIPSQNCKFLGFQFNSLLMSVELPNDKRARTHKLISTFCKQQFCKIREFARMLGTLVSLCPAVDYGWLHTKNMERAKFLALRNAKNNYEATMPISFSLHQDFDWWEKQLLLSARGLIRTHSFKITVFTDASLSGWGAVCGKERAYGHWNENERHFHINYLELLAVFFGLKCFPRQLTDCEILLRVDNTTAISYINRMGGIQYPLLNTVTRRIWDWC